MFKTRARKFSLILLVAILATIGLLLLFNPPAGVDVGEGSEVDSGQVDETEQHFAAMTADGAFAVVSEAIYEQLDEEEANNVLMATDTLDSDPETGESMWIAVISLTNISTGMDVDKHVDQVIEQITTPVDGAPSWKYELVDDSSVLAVETGIIKSLTIWEDNVEPVNPAILNFGYYLVEDEETGEEFYEIVIQSAVIPGSVSE